MKRTITTFAICCLLVLIAHAIIQKKLTVSGNVQEWQATLNVIEQSNAPHQEVKAVTGLIIGQINEQLKADSLKNKKP